VAARGEALGDLQVREHVAERQPREDDDVQRPRRGVVHAGRIGGRLVWWWN
jgi:hypothetical protein